MNGNRPAYPTHAPAPTGPLPMGWHRVTWRRTLYSPEADPFCAMTPDMASMALLASSLKADPEVVPGSVKEESWSDFPPTEEN